MRFYLIGIKGAGMSALAQYLLDMGQEVSGCDIGEELFTEVDLHNRNVRIDPFGILDGRDYDILIVSTAHMNKISGYSSVPVFEYHEFLSFLLRSQKVIAVAGTNGKTTLCNMIDCVLNRETNIIEGDGVGRYVGSDYTVLEACEYRDHFLAYRPTVSIILSLNYDHSDYFQSFEDYLESFKQFALQSDTVFFQASCSVYGFKGLSYSDGDNYAVAESGLATFVIDGHEYRLSLPFFALYQYDLALAALRIGQMFGVDPQTGLTRLKDYKGPRRRLQVENVSGNWFIDDYAHQPHQIEEALKVADRLAPDAAKILIFKPDRKTRLEDFKDEFLQVFEKFTATYLIAYHEITQTDLKPFLDHETVDLFDNFTLTKAKAVYLFLSSKTLKSEYQQVKSLCQGTYDD